MLSKWKDVAFAMSQTGRDNGSLVLIVSAGSDEVGKGAIPPWVEERSTHVKSTISPVTWVHIYSQKVT